MSKLKRRSGVYGFITRAQIETIDFMTRNSKRDTELGIALFEEVYDDNSRTRTVVVRVTNDFEITIEPDGRVRIVESQVF